jgi:hypothetical protein
VTAGPGLCQSEVRSPLIHTAPRAPKLCAAETDSMLLQPILETQHWLLERVLLDEPQWIRAPGAGDEGAERLFAEDSKPTRPS